MNAARVIAETTVGILPLAGLAVGFFAGRLRAGGKLWQSWLVLVAGVGVLVGLAVLCFQE